jgi:4-oxalocrotonate tautomerase
VNSVTAQTETPSTSLLTDDEDLWEDQRGKSLSRLAALEADNPMRPPRATAPSWPEAKGFTNRPDIRSQSQPGSKKRLAIGRSPYTAYLAAIFTARRIPPHLSSDHIFSMPYVNIQITRGATREQKAALVKDVTQSLVSILGKKPEHTHVVIQEIAEEDWGFSGLLTDDWKQQQPK